MREILFRGKGTDEDDKDTWYYGSYMKLDDTTYCCEEDYKRDPDNTKHYIVFDLMTDWCLPNRHMQAKVRPETICQYTGLKDKIGRKIFEGDIVKHEDRDYRCIGKIVFISGEYKIKWSEDVYFRSDMDFWCEERDIEVIGNIFDNPELLEVNV